MIDEAAKTISITWCAQDVIDCADDYFVNKLEEDEAWQILKQLHDNHDCNYGLTWEHIQAAINYHIEMKM